MRHGLKTTRFRPEEEMSKRGSKGSWERNEWRRDRCLIFSALDGTEVGEVVGMLVDVSPLHGIGFEEDTDILLSMAERYALDCVIGLYQYDEERIPHLLTLLREFRKTGELPSSIRKGWC